VVNALLDLGMIVSLSIHYVTMMEADSTAGDLMMIAHSKTGAPVRALAGYLSRIGYRKKRETTGVTEKI